MKLSILFGLISKCFLLQLTGETQVFQELNADQRRESVNSRQRFEAWRAAERRLAQHKGSMVWAETKGRDYLRRSYYDEGSVVRRQTSATR